MASSNKLIQKVRYDFKNDLETKKLEKQNLGSSLKQESSLH